MNKKEVSDLLRKAFPKAKLTGDEVYHSGRAVGRVMIGLEFGFRSYRVPHMGTYDAPAHSYELLIDKNEIEVIRVHGTPDGLESSDLGKTKLEGLVTLIKEDKRGGNHLADRHARSVAERFAS